MVGCEEIPAVPWRLCTAWIVTGSIPDERKSVEFSPDILLDVIDHAAASTEKHTVEKGWKSSMEGFLNHFFVI